MPIGVSGRIWLLTWKNLKLLQHNKWRFLWKFLPLILSFTVIIYFSSNIRPEELPAKIFPSLSLQNFDFLIKHLEDEQVVTPPKLAVGYSPQCKLIDGLMKEAGKSIGVEVHSYKNSSYMEGSLESENYLALIQFSNDMVHHKDYPDHLLYHIRFPFWLRTSRYNWCPDRLYTHTVGNGPTNPHDVDGGSPPGYLREGFLPLQNAISMTFIKLKSGRDDLPEILLERFPYGMHHSHTLLDKLELYILYSIFACLIYLFMSTTKDIVWEKQCNLTKYLRLMGFNTYITWLSWFITVGGQMLVLVTLILACLKVKWTHDTALLVHSDWSVIYVFLIIYGLSGICFCFMMSTIFRHSTSASICTAIFMFTSLVYFDKHAYYSESSTRQLLLSLLSNGGLSLGLRQIVDLENSYNGLKWENISKPVNFDAKYRPIDVVLMMLASCVICLVLGLYFERICPGNFAKREKWNFIFTSSCCKKTDKRSIARQRSLLNNTTGLGPEAFENITTNKRVGLTIKELDLDVNYKPVLKDISMKAYEDEITVILGHIGAGKTTLVSGLLGLTNLTHGEVSILGYDISQHPETAASKLSFCPSHNIFFDSLTMAENFEFYSRLKGLKGKRVKEEIQYYVDVLNAKQLANKVIVKLAKGMQRKVAVCCALCGSSQVVICDEPTLNVDTVAQNEIWDLLQSEKIARTIVVTTSSCTEADVLSDRLALLCNGHLIGFGSPSYFKREFGHRLRLTCIKGENCNASRITEVIAKYIPEIRPSAESDLDVIYDLPEDYLQDFDRLFDELEDRMESLRVRSYSLGNSSLEEVVIRMCPSYRDELTNPSKTNTGLGESSRYITQLERKISIEKELDQNRTYCKWLHRNQWHAMLLKKWYYILNKKSYYVFQSILPVLSLIVGLIFLSSALHSDDDHNPESLELNLAEYPKIAEFVVSEPPEFRETDIEANVAAEYKKILKKSGFEIHETRGATMADYMLNQLEEEESAFKTHHVAGASFKPNAYTAYFNNAFLHSAPLSINLLHNALAKAIIDSDASIRVFNSPMAVDFEDIKKAKLFHDYDYFVVFKLCHSFYFLQAFYAIYITRELVTDFKLLQYMNGVSPWVFWSFHLIWDMMTFSHSTLIIILGIESFGIDGLETFDELSCIFVASLVFGFAALPFTYLFAFVNRRSSTGFAVTYILGIFFGVWVFFLRIRDERTRDTINIFMSIFPTYAFTEIVKNAYISQIDRRDCYRIISYGFSKNEVCAKYSQCCNFDTLLGWQRPGVGMDLFFMFCTGIVYFLLLICIDIFGQHYSMRYFRDYLMQYLPKKRKKVNRFSRYPDLDVKFEQICIQNMTKSELELQSIVIDKLKKQYGNNVIVENISLHVNSFECFGIVGVDGSGKTSIIRMVTGQIGCSTGNVYIKGVRVKGNIKRIWKRIGYCSRRDGLYPDYKATELIKIFCILNLIPIHIVNTLVDELLDLFDIKSSYRNIPIIYCPNGVARKISIIVAMLSAPTIIIMDEPTSNIEPMTRRLIWDMIVSLRDAGKAILITTDNMEESKLLCTRMGIIVNGRFTSIGTVKQLTDQFCTGITLRIKTKPRLRTHSKWDSTVRKVTAMIRMSKKPKPKTKMDKRMNQTMRNMDALTTLRAYKQHTSVPNPIKAIVENEFPEAELQQDYTTTVSFYIPKSAVKWSKIFAIVERKKSELNIEEYYVSATTLEEVFLQFSQKQSGEDAEEER